MAEKIIKTEEEYLALFKDVKNEKYLMDGSIFTMFFKDSIKGIKDFCPDYKAIIIIRNPVDRIMSHYSMQKYRAEENRNFEEFIKYPVSREGISLLELGLYSQQIGNTYEVLDRENVMIILFDDFKKDLNTCLKNVYEFLGIDNIPTPETDKVYHKSRGLVKNNSMRNLFGGLERIWYKLGNPENKFFRVLKNFARRIAFKSKKPDEIMRKHLIDCYKEDINKTEKITGFDLSDWKR